MERVVDDWLRGEAPSLAGRPVLFTHALGTSSRDPDDAVELFLRYIGARTRVFVVRDPRDVVISHYFQLTRRARRAQDVASPGAFVRDSSRGIDRVLCFMRSCERSLRDDPGPALVLAYEDLKRDAGAELASVLRFFDAPADDDVVAAAAEYGRFENLQRLERAGSIGASSRKLGPRDVADPDSLKIRRGEVGSYAEYLSPDDCAYLEERIAALQPRAFGYLEPGVPRAREQATETHPTG